ncbi:hypothetical protein GCM10007938_28370 [Vibrio zhanjiangensis]|uniref:Transposase n=1 Tax=Vibrio zhanjiangensis TaxID=1046128 RepID=A0ABQ6F2P2_9VIBR|nr:hypothetical protein GCM10007938_28370 [Vibrio zhanjiangensis]
MSSKRYPEEFKIEAVKQVTEKGHSVADIAASNRRASQTKKAAVYFASQSD